MTTEAVAEGAAGGARIAGIPTLRGLTMYGAVLTFAGLYVY